MSPGNRLSRELLRQGNTNFNILSGAKLVRYLSLTKVCCVVTNALRMNEANGTSGMTQHKLGRGHYFGLQGIADMAELAGGSTGSRMTPQRSSVVQPPTRAQNVDVLIRLGDEHATGDTVFGVDQLA